MFSASQTIRPPAKIVAEHDGQTVISDLCEDTVDGKNKHLLFRPMIPDDWNIIFP
ncbi:hypothetical protein E4U52_003176, partial [Claviceps spartinae]